MAQRYAGEALQLVEQSDDWRREEMDYLQGTGDPWDNFYQRYHQIKDYHRRIS
jgi:splicing factor 3A subunit 3